MIKKFCYILSNNFSAIEVARISSDRYRLLTDLIGFDLVGSKDKLVEVKFEASKLMSILQSLVEERRRMPPDNVSYQGRFSEDDIYVEKRIFDQVFKLCTTGFDNQLAFVANLLEHQQSKNLKDVPTYIFLAETHKELRDFLQDNPHSENANG